MLINHLKTAYPDFNTRPPNITDLTGFYKEAKKRLNNIIKINKIIKYIIMLYASVLPTSRTSGFYKEGKKRSKTFYYYILFIDIDIIIIVFRRVCVANITIM